MILALLIFAALLGCRLNVHGRIALWCWKRRLGLVGLGGLLRWGVVAALVAAFFGATFSIGGGLR